MPRTCSKVYDGSAFALRTPNRRDKIPSVPTTRELLDTTIALEKQSMALYARFAKLFDNDQTLHEFWFGMARDEARHVGALQLVLTVLGFEEVLDRKSPIPVQDEAIERL